MFSSAIRTSYRCHAR